jgi:glycosyltransferase involved in cell wall biosynthesis
MLAMLSMRVLIFHGYLLRGTGSNVYNAELARALLALGHDVDLVCQERAAEDFDWVSGKGCWNNAGELVVEDLAHPPQPGHGSCVVYNPPIADQLPVYVQDHYKGFTARTFDQFDDDELRFHIDRNVLAVRAVVARNKPDFGLANHMIIGPYVLAEAFAGEIPYVVKIHGSAMEYIVRPHPRFLPFARSGVDGARAVLVGSRHIAERAWDTLKIAGLEKRIWLGPPGVDTERFRPLARDRARQGLTDLGEQLLELPRDGYGPVQRQQTAGLFDQLRMAARTSGVLSHEEAGAAIAEQRKGYANDAVDTDAGEALRRLALIGEAPLALYVGKLIVSKGVDLLISAWPLVLEQHPDAKLLVVGFGSYREGLELLIDALASGDMVAARWLAQGGRALEGAEPAPLTILEGFFDRLEGEKLESYLAAAARLRESLIFTGRLEHDLLAPLTPAANCQIVPSTFPEAFGMVAAEAAACGVPPICADHSGLAEVTATLQERLSGVAGSVLSFRLSPTSVEQIASRIHTAFTFSSDQKVELASRLVQTAGERFSWSGVAGELIAAGSGQTSSLRRP